MLLTRLCDLEAMQGASQRRTTGDGAAAMYGVSLLSSAGKMPGNKGKNADRE
jgi:hypothetical protein